MRLFSPAGRETGTFLWDKGPVAGWGWTAQQELLLVTKDGQVRQGAAAWAQHSSSSGGAGGGKSLLLSRCMRCGGNGRFSSMRYKEACACWQFQ
jgi:hypothetical protein